MNTNRQKERPTEDHSFARIRRVVIVGTPAVAICTLLLILYLLKTADNSRQAQITMAQVQAHAQKINALEWQIMAERRVDPETLAELQSVKAELLAAVSRLPSRTQPDRIVQEFMPALASYLKSVDREVHLAEAGKFEEGRKFDAEEAGPHFDVLQRKIKEVREEYGQRAESVICRSEIGAIIGHVLATSIILVLFLRFASAKHRTKEALEEVRRQRELILTKDALRQAEEKYRGIFEDAIVGIFQTTPDGRYLSLNRELARMYGNDSPEQRMAEVNDIGNQAYADPAKREEFKRLMEVHDIVRDFQYEVHRRDGTKIWFSENARAVRDASGKTLYYEGTVEDITERKRMEAALKQSEEKYRLLVESIPNVVWSADQEGHTAFASPNVEKISGYTLEETYAAGGRLRHENIHPDDAEKVKKAYQDLFHTHSFDIEYRIRRKDGRWVWLHDWAVSVYEKDGVKYAYGVFSDITERKQAESNLQEAHEKLNLALRESEQHAWEAGKLTELVDILQSCQTVEEAYKITGNTLPTTLSSQSGALCITSPSRNMVEAVATWGGTLATEKTFAPDDCWALRRGKIHRVDDATSPLRCAHASGSPAGGYLCVPLAAHGETLGVLCLERPSQSPNPSLGPPEDPMEALARQASAVGERISLALANLRLREVLRSQSIRDPLTGLFNRRYMEESLERELRRAERNDECVTLLMFDIDHFKQFNDTFGHQAGDTLLRGLGDFLSRRTRGQDVVCRYGGEEFVLILAGASADDGCKRAELLRQELKQLTVQHAGQVLGRISFSIGVSAFPGHGTTAEGLLRAADQALYRAKTEGRDRVVVA